MKKKYISMILSLCMIMGSASQGYAAESYAHTNREDEQVTISLFSANEQNSDVQNASEQDSSEQTSTQKGIGYRKLTGANLATYKVLRNEIKRIADGERDSSEITVNASAMNLRFPQATFAEDFNNALNKKLIEACLVADCPYELYWYNKSAGFGISVDMEYSAGDNIVDTITFRFHVYEKYAGNGDYSLNTEKTSLEKQASIKAQSIVSAAASLSDAKKLEYYKNQICAMTSYDRNAFSSGDTSETAWQLLNVFDEDSSTNVIYEGYAKAFQYLCDCTTFSQDIEVYTVTGRISGQTGTGTGSHVWNLVKMENGKNYLVDVTNCDTGTTGNPDKLFLAGCSGSVADGYTFTIGDKNVGYIYDSEALALYDNEELQLSPVNYYSNSDYLNVDYAEGQSGTIFVSEGEDVTLAVQAESNSDISYQWYQGENVIADATSASYTIAHVTQDMTYRCVVSDQNENEKELTYNIYILKNTDPSEGHGSVVASGTCGTALAWDLNSENTLFIYGNGAMASYGSGATCPWESYKTQIRRIVLEDGVTSIGDKAFSGCSNLRQVTFAETIKKISDYAFSGCTSLTNFTLPEGLESLGEYCFERCETISDVTIPGKCETLGYGMFRECISLETVYIDYVDISSFYYGFGNFFAGCNRLRSVDVNSQHPFLQSIDGVLYIYSSKHKTLLCYPAAKEGNSYTLEEGFNEIAARAFQGSENLVNIVIPDAVTSIPDSAFRDCTKLEHVTLPEDIPEIPLSAFNGCSSLKTFEVPANVKVIDQSAFMGCTSLTNVTLPEGLEEVGVQAFRNCSALTEITLPETLKTLGDYAFVGTGLTEIYIPSSVTTIGDRAVSKDVVIQAEAGSAAETFAKNNGYRFEEVSAPVHVFGPWQVTKEATCEETGSRERKCTTCDRVETEVIPATGHTEVVDKAVAVSCEEAGLTEGKHCSVCDKVLVAQEEIPAAGHKEVVDKAVPASCEKAGHTEGKYCSVCKKVLVEQEVIPATGHKEVVDKAVPASCEETGLTEGKHCSVCKKVLVEQEEIPATGHKEVVDKGIAASCETAGLTEGKHCSVCKKVLVEQEEIPAIGHTEVVDKGVEATCEEAGHTEGKYCSVCKKVLVEQEVIPATGHKEVVDKAVPASCEKAGRTEGKYCSVCKKVLVAQEEIPATGHKEVVDKAVPASCEEAGHTEGKYCSVCKKVLVEQEEIPATGHKEVVDEKVAPTCEKAGRTEGKYCSVCKKVLVEQEEIPATGHAEVVDKAVPASCETAGLTEGKHCSVCDKVLVEQEEIPATGHSFGEWKTTQAANCEEAGSEERKCTACDKVETKPIKATGHTEVVDEKVAATCEETGLTEGKHCSVCEKVLVAQEEIPATGHEYIQGICQHCHAQKTFEAEGFVFKVQPTENGTAVTLITSTGQGAITSDGKLVIPGTISDGQDEYAITEIADSAFRGNSNITSIIIPEEVKKIGEDAFAGCTNVKEIIFEGKEAPEMDESTFADVSPNVEISVPEGANGYENIKPTHIHDAVTDPAEEASCTKAGLTEGSHCKTCGDVIVAQKEIKAFGHDWGEGVVTSEATYTAKGIKTYTCNRCKEIRTEEIDILEPVKVSAISITGLSKQIAAGKKLQLTASVAPEAAMNKEVIWTSSNPKVATVTARGLVVVKAKTGGKSVKITATAADGSGVKAVYVIKSMKAAVTKITGKNPKAPIAVGKTVKLSAKVTAKSGANKKLKWISSNPKFATVTNGKVKALAAGKGKTVSITAMATDGSGKKKVYKVKIK